MNRNSQLAYVTSGIVGWARRRAGLSEQQLAAALKVDPKSVEAWERGNQLPTLRKAEEIAEELRIPFGFLFLSEPPDYDVPLPDLRTMRGLAPSSPSLDFREVLGAALLRQQWYSDYLRGSGAKQLAFVGGSGISEGHEAVAARMTKALRISEQMREDCGGWEQLLGSIAGNAEGLGVVVMQRGVVGNYNKKRLSVQEFRGFAVADKYAPLVFINARDARAARIFTIVHELCHLWIGESGISNPNLRDQTREIANRVERFCNSVAAEVLVPRSSFEERWAPSRPLDSNVSELAAHFLVSRYVVARRAYELDVVGWDEYEDYLDRNPMVWRGGGGTGGNFFNTFFARNGRRFTSAVLGALGSDKISYREASALLDQKMSTLKKIADRLG